MSVPTSYNATFTDSMWIYCRGNSWDPACWNNWLPTRTATFNL